jgi:peptide-methionine (S)-S-oxide reductase
MEAESQLRVTRGIQSRMANSQTAVFGGGCFWCLEAVFERLKGVVSVESGYMGGTAPNPTYKQVCGGNTGHVEVVRTTFNPDEITFRDLLEVLFTIHDPTTLNRQGNDVGTQYRSVVFYDGDVQREETRKYIAELESAHAFDSPIVTAVEPATGFWKAEDYHQQYFDNNSHQPYCQFVIAPKLHKFEKKFAQQMKAS